MWIWWKCAVYCCLGVTFKVDNKTHSAANLHHVFTGINHCENRRKITKKTKTPYILLRNLIKQTKTTHRRFRILCSVTEIEVNTNAAPSYIHVITHHFLTPSSETQVLQLHSPSPAAWQTLTDCERFFEEALGLGDGRGLLLRQQHVGCRAPAPATHTRT